MCRTQPSQAVHNLIEVLATVFGHPHTAIDHANGEHVGVGRVAAHGA
ncbi:MAG: hypothetical protein JO352_23410 [Chloroflexi bacterium]|nr:hypothetical protein [Chloroflexota bacterium]MBV9600931.1 hypothetical protein [Chloroflexota bacterium]